ncbi:MAG: type II toxin-antitoxin system RelE/ParE family toxin [Sulfurovum sp.]|nr:type II toxin-antitoxin system RelE/ParE family toxin [Sulfurovum sp.]
MRNPLSAFNQPSLRLHPLKGKLKDLYSVSIDMQYRISIEFKAVDDGYSQIAIADFLEISRSLVSKVLREEV